MLPAISKIFIGARAILRDSPSTNRWWAARVRRTSNYGTISGLTAPVSIRSNKTGRSSVLRPCPPGRGFYPEGLTRKQIEQYVQDHPEKRAEIYSSTTIVRWHRDQLEGLPYHIVYRPFL